MHRPKKGSSIILARETWIKRFFLQQSQNLDGNHISACACQCWGFSPRVGSDRSTNPTKKDVAIRPVEGTSRIGSSKQVNPIFSPSNASLCFYRPTPESSKPSAAGDLCTELWVYIQPPSQGHKFNSTPSYHLCSRSQTLNSPPSHIAMDTPSPRCAVILSPYGYKIQLPSSDLTFV